MHSNRKAFSKTIHEITCTKPNRKNRISKDKYFQIKGSNTKHKEFPYTIAIPLKINFKSKYSKYSKY